jgi:hypothetical protein
MCEVIVNLVARFLGVCGVCGAAVILYGGVLAAVQLPEKETG